MEETVHFQITPHDAMRLILQLYNEKTNYKTEVSIMYYLNTFISGLSDYELDVIAEECFTDTYDIGKHDYETKALLHALINSKYFEKFVIENNINILKIVDFGVYDKKSKKIYLSSFGKHSFTILKLLELYPELKTIEQKDEFISNNLILIGSANNNYSLQNVIADDEHLCEIDVVNTLRNIIIRNNDDLVLINEKRYTI